MKDFTAGGLRVRATGGTDRDGGGAGPALLLCHGYGAPGDDLVGLARVLDVGAGTRFFVPEAPHGVDTGMGGAGRAWWTIDMARMQLAIARGDVRDLDETPDGLEAATASLTACIDELVAAHAVDPARLVIGGFSQGAMLTTELVLHDPRPFAGLAVLSGTVVSRARWELAAAARAAGLHVLASHGRRDPILPFAGAEALVALLRAAGAEVTFLPFNGQHEIPGSVLDALAKLCRTRLA